MPVLLCKAVMNTQFGLTWSFPVSLLFERKDTGLCALIGGSHICGVIQHNVPVSFV